MTSLATLESLRPYSGTVDVSIYKKRSRPLFSDPWLLNLLSSVFILALTTARTSLLGQNYAHE